MMMILFPKNILKTQILLLINIIINFFMLSSSAKSLISWRLFDQYNFCLERSGFAAIFCLLISILYFIANLYSFFYMKQFPYRQRIFHDSFMPMSLIAAYIIAYSGNLITLFIGYELLTLTTYPLVIQNQGDKSIQAGKYYFLTNMIASNILFLGLIIMLDYYAGNSNFNEQIILKHRLSKDTLIIFYILAIFGVAKTAIFPLSQWLVKAMEAPVPVSALLHAVLVVNAGFFSLLKIISYLKHLSIHLNIDHSYHNLLIIFCCITIIFAGYKNLSEKILKRVLAYSTISQLSYMMLLMAIDNTKALVISFIYMVNHSIAKLALFFAGGIIQIIARNYVISSFSGMFHQAPIAVLIFIFASLSIMALPPSFGFVLASSVYQIIPKDFFGYLIIFTFALSSLMMSFYFFRLIFSFIAKTESNNLPAKIRGNKIKYLNIVSLAVILLMIPLYFYYPKIIAILEVDLN